MPVPKPSATNPSGRRLIRDIAYTRIRDEILSGQFEPGERLQDDALIAWLQVSRTPIREAIAKLAVDGLVEMVPNRYTRIPDRSADAYARAAEYMQMIRGFALTHLDRVPAPELRGSQKRMAELVPALREHDRAAQVAFNEEFGELAAQVGNPLIEEAEQRVRSQAQFHLQHQDAVVDWDSIIDHATQVVDYQA
jgi:DNA-binding GntR family transcriptional regulator